MCLFKKKTFEELYKEMPQKDTINWEMSHRLGKLAKAASTNEEIMCVLNHWPLNLSGKQKKLLASKITEEGLTPEDYLVLWNNTRNYKWLRVDPGDNYELSMLMATYFHRGNESDRRYWNIGIQNAIRILTNTDASLYDLCQVYRLKMDPRVWHRINKASKTFKDWLLVTRECTHSYAAYVKCLEAVRTEEELALVPKRQEKESRRRYHITAAHIHEILALQ